MSNIRIYEKTQENISYLVDIKILFIYELIVIK
jgi:hypothetical protein